MRIGRARGQRRATSAGSTRHGVGVAPARRRTRCRPPGRCPLARRRAAARRPTLAAPNVTVRSARTASPSTAPVAPSTPDGMSTDTIGGVRPAFIASIAACHSSSGTPRKPVPKIASTTTSARASSRRRRLGASTARPARPCSPSRAGVAEAAGSRSLVERAPPRSRRRACRRRARCRAATKPSPPLLPLPHTTTARRPYTPPRRVDCAPARPRGPRAP